MQGPSKSDNPAAVAGIPGLESIPPPLFLHPFSGPDSPERRRGGRRVGGARHDTPIAGLSADVPPCFYSFCPRLGERCERSAAGVPVGPGASEVHAPPRPPRRLAPSRTRRRGDSTGVRLNTLLARAGLSFRHQTVIRTRPSAARAARFPVRPLFFFLATERPP